jgi:hypothetical protein
MAGYAGFDTYAFPGPAQMAWLQANTNLVWCGYYLPAPSHPNGGWLGQRAALAQAGWGLAPIFVGQQLSGPGRHQVTAGRGSEDGRTAAAVMRHDGFDPGACVYLDLEDGPPLRAPRAGYVAAWIDAVTAQGYTPGVYCSHLMGAAAHALRPAARVWAYAVRSAMPHPVHGTNFPDLHPAACGYAGAYVWQLGQSCRLTLPGAPATAMTVDLDSAVSPDPSAP